MRKLVNGKIIIKVLLCIIWLSIIFYNGTRPGEISQKSSKGIIKIVSMFVDVPSDNEGAHIIKFSNLNAYVRKNAHFFEYLILSILLCAAVRQFKLYKSSEIFLLLFLLLLCPVIDEFIQKYIPGRTSNIFDIIIDFSGGVVGILIWNIGAKFSKRKVPLQL